MPVSLGAGLGASHLDSPLLLGSEGHLNVAEDSSGAVKFVVEEYNRREDDDEYYKLVKVHEVSSQVRYYFWYQYLYIGILESEILKENAVIAIYFWL